MKLDGHALAWSVAAVATPTLLRTFMPRGYVTAAQKAALADFQNAPGPTLAPVVGDAIDHAIDVTSLSVVADTLLAAAHDGAFVVVANAQGGEAYNPLDSNSWFVGTVIDGGFGGGTSSIREAQWQALADANASGVSSFGAAVGRVMRARGGSDAGELGGALRELASSMDDLGVRAQAPADVTPLSWARDQLSKLLPSTTTLVLAGAAIVGGVYLARKAGLV